MERAHLLAPRVWRSIASSVLFDVVSLASSILLTPLVLHHLGREQFGLQLSLEGLIAYFGLADLGLGQTVTRYVAGHVAKGERGELSKVLDTAFGLYALVGCAVLAFGSALAPFLDDLLRIPPELVTTARAYLLVVTVKFALSMPLSLFGGICIGFGRFDAWNAGRMVGTLLNVGLTLLAVRLGEDVLGLAVFTAVAPLATAFVHWRALAWLAPGLRIDPRRLDRGVARELLGFSVFFWVNHLIVLLVFHTDNLVIGGTLGLGMVTAYGITQRLLASGMQITFKLSDSLYPTYAGLDAVGRKAELRTRYVAVMRYSVAVASAVAVVMTAYGPWLIRLWTGPEGYAGFFVVACFAGVLLVHTPVHVASGLVAACGNLRALTAASVLEGGLNLGLSIWWARTMGLGGVALATLLSMVVTTGWFVPLYALRHVEAKLLGHLATAVAPGLLSMVPTALVAGSLAAWLPAESALGALAQGALVVGVAAASLAQLRRHTRRSVERDAG